MGRPRKCRQIDGLPAHNVFKPAGVPVRLLPEVVLSVDEFEALRLADHDGLHHEPAARRMAVSRATFGRIVESARRKVVRALVEGCVLRIEGGTFTLPTLGQFTCEGCGHAWQVAGGPGQPGCCPNCRHQPNPAPPGGPCAPA